MKRWHPVLLVAVLTACSGTKSYKEIAGTQAIFDPGANLQSQSQFYDFPWPSDLRLDAGGHPDMTGFPNLSSNKEVGQLLSIVPARKGFPVIAAAYFQFSAPLKAMTPDTAIAASKTAPLILIDADPKSPEVGKMFPVVASTLAEDDYTPKNMLVVAPPLGLVLKPHRTYAYLVMRSLNDAGGASLGIPAAFQQMKGSSAPTGAAAKAYALYKPLWPILSKAGISIDNVAGATVFTTGDVVQDLADIGTQLVAKYPVQIDPSSLKVNPDSANYPRFCELQGTLTVPQFQQGMQPFDSQGTFVMGADGLPEKQGDMTIPIVITLPKSPDPMPAAGYPLAVYEHGSGGVSTQVVDRGPQSSANGPMTPGQGPAYVVGKFGIAAASSALPLNPERYTGSEQSDYDYLNVNNLGVFPFTFEQGVIEQRMYIQALKSLQIPASVVSSCTGLTLPSGATAFQFDPDKLILTGQSMGAMYTNMIGSTEPRVKIVVPTGAGGLWPYMILTTHALPLDGQTLMQQLIGVNETLNYLHPALQLIETAWEAADPVVYTPRMALRPLAGAPARPIYEPIGEADDYFSPGVLDAMALGYGNQEAGPQIWPELQTELSYGGFGGLATYPVSQNRTSANGSAYTGVVVEYHNDGILSGHYISLQVDAVKYQYGCFLDSFLKTGVAKVLDPPAGYVETNPTPCGGG